MKSTHPGTHPTGHLCPFWVSVLTMDWGGIGGEKKEHKPPTSWATSAVRKCSTATTKVSCPKPKQTNSGPCAHHNSVPNNRNRAKRSLPNRALTRSDCPRHPLLGRCSDPLAVEPKPLGKPKIVFSNTLLRNQRIGLRQC